MNVLRMLRFGGLGVFYAPEADAGSGGQTQGAGDAGGDAPGAGDPSDGGDDAGGDTGAGDDAADDDDESLLLGDDETDQRAVPLEEQIARLRKANRRLKGRVLKHKPIADRLRGVDLDDVVASARNFRELQRAAQTNPKIRALLNGAGDSDGDGREPRRTEPAPAALPPLPTDYTAETLGFDPAESTANRVLAAAIQHTAALARRVAELESLTPTVRNLDQTVRSQHATAEKAAWESALGSLEAELKRAAPENQFLVTLARDAIYGAYQTRQQHRQSPQAIVKGYLAQLTKAGLISKKQATKVDAATQSRMVAHNRNLPRSPAGGGQPSGAAGNERRLLKDVHKQLRAGSIGPR